MENIFGIDINLSKQLHKNYSLQNKHLFKKKAGNARYYYQLCFDNNLESDLKEISNLYNNNIPFKIFGMHTNIYITENGYDGIFIDVNPKNSYIIYDETKKSFRVSSNTIVSKFVNYTMKMGYDFAAFAGIPGEIGAGVVGNSGYTPSGKCFADYVEEIIAYDFEKNEKVIFKDLNNFFDERDSFIKRENKTRYFVLEVTLKSENIGMSLVKDKYDAQIKERREALFYGYTEGTAGSLWSNAHLKRQVGKSFTNMLIEHPEINQNINGARYSSNGIKFFTTDRNTTDKDVADLFIHSVKKAKEIYNIELHKEVLILDSDGEIDLETFIKRVK